MKGSVGVNTFGLLNPDIWSYMVYPEKLACEKNFVPMIWFALAFNWIGRNGVVWGHTTFSEV